MAGSAKDLEGDAETVVDPSRPAAPGQRASEDPAERMPAWSRDQIPIDRAAELEHGDDVRVAPDEDLASPEPGALKPQVADRLIVADEDVRAGEAVEKSRLPPRPHIGKRNEDHGSAKKKEPRR